MSIPAAPEIAAASKTPVRSRLAGLMALPGVGFAVLPLCPVCWPVYAGVAGALGLSATLNAAWQLPLTVLFLLVAVAALGYRARARRGYGPLGAGLAASAIVLVGKFIFMANAVAYAGGAALLLAALWNVWPRRAAATDAENCAACESV